MEIFESLIPVGIVLLCIAGVVALGAMAYLFITLTKSRKRLKKLILWLWRLRKRSTRQSLLLSVSIR